MECFVTGRFSNGRLSPVMIFRAVKYYFEKQVGDH